MKTVSLLEQLAGQVHHRTNLNELISTQPSRVQEAFLKNDIASLKNQLGNTENLADKSTVFQV